MRKMITQHHRNKAVISLLIIVALLFVINATRKINTTAIEKSFESVYKDRLVVDDYIFRISRLVEYKRDEINGVNNGQIDLDYAYDSINVLLVKYAATEFTNDESKYFADLRMHLNHMEELEILLNTTENPQIRTASGRELNAKALVVLHELEVLSDIQFIEAGNLFEKSKNRKQSSFLVSKLELALMVIACIIGIALISPNPLQKIIDAKLLELN